MTIHKDALRELNIWPLRIVGGQVFRLTVTVTDTDGAAQDLTGCQIHLRVKEEKTDDDVDAVLELDTGDGIEHASPQSGATEGQAEIRFEAEDTTLLEGLIPASDEDRTFFYEVWVVDGAGKPQPVIDASSLKVRRGLYSP